MKYILWIVLMCAIFIPLGLHIAHTSHVYCRGDVMLETVEEYEDFMVWVNSYERTIIEVKIEPPYKPLPVAIAYSVSMPRNHSSIYCEERENEGAWGGVLGGGLVITAFGLAFISTQGRFPS